jgi:hypothetical protein
MEEVGREHDSSVVAVAVEDFTPAKVSLIQLVLVSPYLFLSFYAIYLVMISLMIVVRICQNWNHLLLYA